MMDDFIYKNVGKWVTSLTWNLAIIVVVVYYFCSHIKFIKASPTYPIAQISIKRVGIYEST